MNITDYIEECRKQRHDLSFAFLAERCPASEEAPYRIKPCSPIAPDENCVLILAGTGGRNVNLRGYNSILKKPIILLNKHRFTHCSRTHLRCHM